MKAPQRRIHADLAELQHKSELLVAFLQLGVAALLGLIYFIAPVGHPPDAAVRSVPLGLGLFVILVLVRLWFAYSKQLNAMFLFFSVVTEMALLIFIIGTYHLQFEALPNIDLKNTHIAYVFVLIALRGLRFEPRWVVVSGVTAMLGWTLLVAYVLHVTGQGVITWDYVTYASTRSLHPGGEFDKILAIGLVTGITAYTLSRARDTLFTAVSQTQATKELSKFFDTDVAMKITESEDGLMVGSGEIRHAAILFTDMRGFTKASAHLSPSELIALLAEYQQLVVPIIRQFGGSIDKFMGDGILASFGAVSACNQCAANVLRTVDAIMLAADSWSEMRRAQGLVPVAIGAGVAVGEVVFGVIGDHDRLEYTVIGETVNLAAKLEKHNKPENARALTNGATLTEALSQGYAPPAPKEIRLARTVAGVTEPLDIVVLA
ncbi:MAG: adenylate/guanylate cyclase domain-containing protein [Rickettsiales bacterium]